MTQTNELVTHWTPLSNKRLQDLDEHSWQRVRGVVLKAINLLFEYEKAMTDIKFRIDEHLNSNEPSE